MTRTFARGACPGLSAPMETGDGLLARLVPAAPIPLDAFVSLCEAARAHGNGIMEVSARGNLQVRGLTPLSAPLFAADVAGLDIELGDGVPVIADPLPDDPAALIDSDAVASMLRSAIAKAGLRLAPKVSVIIDGGGSLDLDPLFADIRLTAVAAQGGPRVQISLAGDAQSATPIATVAPEDAVDAVLALLARIAALGPRARAADLLPVQTPTEPRAKAKCAPRADAVGLHALKDGALALGVGLAFGHAEARSLAELARVAASNGAIWARPAPGRTLLLGPSGEADAMATRQTAGGLGFVTRADDPGRRIAACPGAPLCMHGLIASRALAAELARALPLPAGRGIALHVSGCTKGCAHPSPAPLTVVGTEKGCGIVRGGTARDRPSRYVGVNDLVAALGRRREVAHA